MPEKVTEQTPVSVKAYPLIYRQMAKVMQYIEAITKDRSTTTGAIYKFRGIDDIYNAIHKHLADAGVFTMPKVLSREQEERTSKNGNALIWTKMRMQYTFFAEDGSNVEAILDGEAMDSGDKGINKAESAAHKYCFVQVFCIETQDPIDTENETSEIAPVKVTVIKPVVTRPIAAKNREIIEQGKNRLIEAIKNTRTKEELQEVEKKYAANVDKFGDFTVEIDHALESKFELLENNDFLKDL